MDENSSACTATLPHGNSQNFPPSWNAADSVCSCSSVNLELLTVDVQWNFIIDQGMTGVL